MNLQLISKVMLPEFIIILGIIITIFASVNPKGKKLVPGVCSLTLACATLYIFGFLHPLLQERAVLIQQGIDVNPMSFFFNSFISDSLSVYFRGIIYGISFLISLAAGKYLKPVESPAEYYPILLTAALGGGILTGVNDFLALFVAIETLGLSSILLSSYARLSQKSNEAGLKYLISSAAGTALLLLAISFIYGLTGKTNFFAVHYQLQAMGSGLSFAVKVLFTVLLSGSIAFKLAAAPFHNWSPDVYTGAPTTTTAFLSVVSKTAALGLAIRLFTTTINNDIATFALVIFAGLSIIIGNYLGVTQMISRGSLKRLLAYSSIAQAGYLVVALALGTFDTGMIAALITYLSIYALMNTGAFLCAIYLESETGSDNIYDLAGMIKKRPGVTLAFALCLINLAGLPLIPAAFIAKFYLFAFAFSSGYQIGQTLAIIGLVGSAIGLFYYLYLAKIMIVDAPANTVKSLPESQSLYCPISKLGKDKESETKVGYDWAHLGIAIAIVLLVWFGVFDFQSLRETALITIQGLGI